MLLLFCLMLLLFCLMLILFCFMFFLFCFYVAFVLHSVAFVLLYVVFVLQQPNVLFFYLILYINLLLLYCSWHILGLENIANLSGKN